MDNIRVDVGVSGFANTGPMCILGARSRLVPFWAQPGTYRSIWVCPHGNNVDGIWRDVSASGFAHNGSM